MVNGIEGKRVLVTGAANGIGQAIANMFAISDAKVIGFDLSEKSEPYQIIRCDIRQETEIIQAVAKATEILGGLDILVNNAGIMQEAKIADITTDMIDKHFSVNVRGTILVTREVLKHLKPGARIINIASELAYLGRQEASVYCASKAAILGLTRSWARELAPHILVNAVAPGPTDTTLLSFDKMTDTQKSLETAHPLGRIGRPDEIASTVLFLAGSGATFFTGQCLGANGGAAML